MDEHGASSKTQIEEKGLSSVERGMGHWGGIQECCQSMQGSNEEGCFDCCLWQYLGTEAQVPSLRHINNIHIV